jgi:hypothetical protein
MSINTCKQHIDPGMATTHFNIFIRGSELRTYVNSVPSKHRVFIPECLDEILTSTQNSIQSFFGVKSLRPVWVKQ